ncbi:GH32 C-terminal domain-containing protein [Sporosarcina sp. FSL K6-3457]
MPEQKHGWAGALTLPRELKFNEYGELSMTPIKELQQLRAVQNVVEPTTINDNIRLAAIKGDQLEMIAEFSLKDSTAEKFGLNIRCSADGKQKTEIFYHTTEGKVGIDRNLSGHGEGGIRQSIIHGRDRETLKLHLFIDKSSLELFVNDGETVMTAGIYPDETSISVELFSDNGETKLIQLDA